MITIYKRLQSTSILLVHSKKGKGKDRTLNNKRKMSWRLGGGGGVVGWACALCVARATKIHELYDDIDLCLYLNEKNQKIATTLLGLLFVNSHTTSAKD